MNVTRAQIDHLVVHAATLEQGVAWCERTLGITPGPGGEHPLMGTHNRVFSVGNGAYAEIIAINPAAPRPTHPRWFGMDGVQRLQQVAVEPRLVHFVVNVPNIAEALKASPYDMGAALQASRGELRWQISVRSDGALLEGGLIPTLIEWGELHPTTRMPASGLLLTGIRFEHPQIERIEAAHRAMGLSTGLQPGAVSLNYHTATDARWCATLQTAGGAAITIHS
jgi:hypothetical protein